MYKSCKAIQRKRKGFLTCTVSGLLIPSSVVTSTTNAPVVSFDQVASAVSIIATTTTPIPIGNNIVSLLVSI